MKHTLFILFTALVLTACGTKKAITATEEIAASQETETAATVIPEREAPEVETDIIETPTPPATPIPVAVKVVQPEPTKDAVAEPTLEPVEEVVERPLVAFPNHNNFGSLLATHVTPEGNVNYAGFKSNWNVLRAYIKDLGTHMPTDTWSKEDKLSYWMNAYNAMTVDLILRNQPVASIKDIKDPWDQRLWKLGSKWYNLNEIEHQILRKMGDARIHFGINCASFSCPPLLNEAFTADKVDAQLESLSRKFVNDTKRNTITENSIEVSKIFTWFAKDFKTNGSLIDFLNQYSETTISDKAKKRYKDYDWTLNN